MKLRNIKPVKIARRNETVTAGDGNKNGKTKETC